ncbi:Hypothetical predicted protein, partial [Pelobates cultripes]
APQAHTPTSQITTRKEQNTALVDTIPHQQEASPTQDKAKPPTTFNPKTAHALQQTHPTAWTQPQDSQVSDEIPTPLLRPNFEHPTRHSTEGSPWTMPVTNSPLPENTHQTEDKPTHRDEQHNTQPTRQTHANLRRPIISTNSLISPPLS